VSEVIHESRGLRIHRNPKNRFCVVRLHYTADPAKRSKQWLAEAKAGMHPAQFEREYEISYTALLGEKVFPEIGSYRDQIIRHPPFPEWGKEQPFWAGFDYGARNPASFHVYTIDDGVIYSIWELYEPCKNIPEFCQKLKDCPYYSRLRYIASDPDVFSKKSHDKFGNPTSVGALMAEQGITKLIPGNNNEDTFIAEIRKRWADPEDITFKIYDTCVYQIREFEMAIYPMQSEKLLLASNAHERIQDKNNHALDDAKYFFNSRPANVSHNITFPNMAKKWRT
jgi:hypothetical protein